MLSHLFMLSVLTAIIALGIVFLGWTFCQLCLDSRRTQRRHCVPIVSHVGPRRSLDSRPRPDPGMRRYEPQIQLRRSA